MTENRTFEMPAEWNGKVPTRVFVDESLRILRVASEAKVALKMLGGLAIKVHSLNEGEFSSRLGRSLGYSKRPSTMSTSASQRQIYFHSKGWFYIDVFWDKLKAANHPINFRGRLEIDPISIPLADLLLEKLQIVSFSNKDLIDTLLLLKAHDVAEKEGPEIIGTDRVARVLSRAWGFWYTVTTNLRGIKEYVKKMTVLSPQELSELIAKVDQILSTINSTPKSLRWRLRAVVGTKKKWYNPVETEETVGGFGIWRLRNEAQP